MQIAGNLLIGTLALCAIPLRDWLVITYRGALPLSMPMPIVLLGGIYSGAFTPTEATAVAALHALILAGVGYRALSWRSFWVW